MWVRHKKAWNVLTTSLYVKIFEFFQRLENEKFIERKYLWTFDDPKVICVPSFWDIPTQITPSLSSQLLISLRDMKEVKKHFSDLATSQYRIEFTTVNNSIWYFSNERQSIRISPKNEVQFVANCTGFVVLHGRCTGQTRTGSRQNKVEGKFSFAIEENKTSRNYVESN